MKKSLNFEKTTLNSRRKTNIFSELQVMSHNYYFFNSQLRVYISQFWEKVIIVRYKLVILRKKVRIVSLYWLYVSHLQVYIMKLWEKSQSCEIKSSNNLFNFLISVGNGASILLRPNARIKYTVTHQTFPQPLMKRSCKTTLCMCKCYMCICL